MMSEARQPPTGKREPAQSAAPAATSGDDPCHSGPNSDQTDERAVAHPAVDFDAITIVHVPSDSDARLCKVIGTQGTADIDDLPYLCTFSEVKIGSTNALADALAQLAGDSKTCILRARPLGPGPSRRILHDQGGDVATLEDVPRAWVLIDLDSIDCPEGIDFTREPHKAAVYARRHTLPPEFHKASCVWHASSNAGLKPGIRLHLWYYLSAALDTEQLKHWLRDTKCDKKALGANQPLFTADPIFDGVPDPMSKRRGILQGSPRVHVPAEIIAYTTPAKSRTGVSSSDRDPLKTAALRAWEAANPFDAPGSSERIPCPACGSSDGIAVREDLKWNCHGGKHIDNAPAIGTYTGSVYVGHRIEFQLRLTAKEVIPYLKNHNFWPKIALPEKFTGHTVAAETRNDGDDAQVVTDPTEQAQLAKATPAGVASADEVRPNLRQHARAKQELRHAVSAAMTNPTQLANIAEDCARWMPHCLNETTVHVQLRDAAVRAHISVALTATEADAVITEAFVRGKARPHVKRRYDTDGPQLPLDEHGQPARSIATVYYFCSRSEILRVIALDDRSHRVVVIEPPPWWRDDDREFPRALEPADLPRLSVYVSGRFGFPHAGIKDVAHVLNSIAQDRCWDPVEDYLDGLTWEGTDQEAREFLGAVPKLLLRVRNDDDYTRAVFMRWAIAAVQRTYEPGCQFREVMTLIGRQNVGKSQFLLALCADSAWFSDTVAADGSKDSRSALDGKWIVEFAEVDKHMRADRTGEFKNYISTQVDSYRRVYGEVDQDMRRRCVFAASSNVYELFVDPTGNTRFNPLIVEAVDLETTREWRDDIWAAAKHLYRAGEPAYLQGEERSLATLAQNALLRKDEAEDLLRELFEKDLEVQPQRAGGPEKTQVRFEYDAEQLIDVTINANTGAELPTGVHNESETKTVKRLAFLTFAQIRLYLRERGCNTRREGVHTALRHLGWTAGRVVRSGHPLHGNKSAWGRSDALTCISEGV
jgi:hypothetical protein